MPTLKEDLWPFIIEIAQVDTQFEVRDIDRWTDNLMAILRRHPYDLMQLATVRKVNPNIDTLPAPERNAKPPLPVLKFKTPLGVTEVTYEVEFDEESDDTATDYFKDDPQGKGW